MNRKHMKRADNVDAKLDDIQHLLVNHQLVGGVIQKQAIKRQVLAENMAYRQNLHQLEDKLNQLHPADFAMLLEQLPLPERLIVWGWFGRDMMERFCSNLQML